MARTRSWRRVFNRHIGLGTAGLGTLIVLSSFLFLDNLFAWYATVMLGLLVVMAGFLYAAYPVLTSERRFLALRAEVDNFVFLVRQLNSAATPRSGEAPLEEVKSAMIESVERMAALAGKETSRG
jgi:hypothetical protein